MDVKFYRTDHGGCGRNHQGQDNGSCSRGKGRDNGQVFSGGANVVMRKITPNCYKHMYEIYPAQLPDTDIPAQRAQLEKQIRSLGRVPL